MLARLRYRLGTHDATLAMVLIAAPCGLVTGLLINLFHLSIDGLGGMILSWLGESHVENLDTSLSKLDQWSRFLLPVVSAALLGLIYQALKPNHRFTGLTHTVVRVHKFNGVMPLRNGLLQFFGGCFALGAGHSGGKEGPAIHIGAAANSYLAQRLHLPHNSLRILAACGAAGAIGASFNTPVAGVLFAIEVILMEYTLASVIPIVVAAISATSVTQLIRGNESVFQVPTTLTYSLWELPLMIALGLLCGVAAMAFMRVQIATQKFQNTPVFIRFLFAGLLTGCIAWFIPQTLGIGYGHVSESLVGSHGWQILLLLCLAKIVASAVSNGVGMPVGIIGPSVVIGASLGGLLGLLAGTYLPGTTSDASFYMLLGMGGVMGALLNAPLAALMAILEMARSPEAILPGIVVIVIASLCTEKIFGQLSVVEAVLKKQGIQLRSHPIAQALNRISLSAVADTNIGFIEGEIPADALQQLESEAPRYVVIKNQNDAYFLLPRKGLEQINQEFASSESHPPEYSDLLLDKLRESDIAILPLLPCPVVSTVTEARTMLNREEHIEGLYVFDPIGSFQGVLRKEALRRLIDSW